MTIIQFSKEAKEIIEFLKTESLKSKKEKTI